MASNIDEETVTPAAKRPRLEAEKNSTSSDIMAELPNPYLKELKNDFLYHIGYTREDCEKLFQDVKVTSFIRSRSIEPCMSDREWSAATVYQRSI